jgi:hypothetical protein|tara:strand:- start:14274 stop:14543 length:270 start_codon:yes stop_codon:yes gene_type:complete
VIKVHPNAIQEQIRGRYTIRLNGRDGLDPKLTYKEAAAMYMLGFRFSIFDPATGEFNVSRSYTTFENMDRGILTLCRTCNVRTPRSDRA